MKNWIIVLAIFVILTLLVEKEWHSGEHWSPELTQDKTENQFTTEFAPPAAQDGIKSYLERSARRFPVSPIDKLIFFNPEQIVGKQVVNAVLLDIPYNEIRTATAKVLVSFLTSYVDFVQKFNCENHLELIKQDVRIVNFLFTRESSGLNFQIPTIKWNERELSIEAGFETSLNDCKDLSSDGSLRVEEHKSPGARLLSIFESQAPRGIGTGWPLKNGLVVTNKHVIAGATKIFLVRADQEFIEAKPLVVDGFEDLALLRVDHPEFLPDAFEIDPTDLNIGKEIFTIGYPWTSGRPFNALPHVQLTKGIVSSLPDDERRYQLSLPVQSGNSGGPLFDITGKVVGIVSAKMVRAPNGDKPEMVGYAIKAGRLAMLLEYLSKEKRLKTVKLGQVDANLEDIASKLKGSVLLIFTI